ncbi:MAG: cfiA [Deltaproteobacteria bacterium]|nr:cfiA [Deltaproteobacteria bacterium]
MSEIRFIDTTVRDGNQSLWALNMRVGAMLPIAEQMDQAGFESMEFFLSVMFKKYVREHKENPWEWVREGTKRINSRLEKDRHGYCRQSHLLGLASSHRRILRPESQRSGSKQSMANLLQGRRRLTHARASANSDSRRA